VVFRFEGRTMKKLLWLVVLAVVFAAPAVACSHGAPPTPPPENNDFGA